LRQSSHRVAGVEASRQDDAVDPRTARVTDASDVLGKPNPLEERAVGVYDGDGPSAACRAGHSWKALGRPCAPAAPAVPVKPRAPRLPFSAARTLGLIWLMFVTK